MKLRVHHKNIYTCHKFVSTFLRNPYCCAMHGVPEKRNYCSGKVQPFFILRSSKIQYDVLYWICVYFPTGFKESWREEIPPGLPASQLELSNCILNITKQCLYISKRSTKNNCISKLHIANHYILHFIF